MCFFSKLFLFSINGIEQEERFEGKVELQIERTTSSNANNASTTLVIAVILVTTVIIGKKKTLKKCSCTSLDDGVLTLSDITVVYFQPLYMLL